MNDTLFQKIADGRTDLVFDFIEQRSDAKSKDAHGTSLIQWCAYYGDVSAIKYLLSKGVSLSDLGENFDLNGAVFHRHWQLCQFLLEQGADAKYADIETGENLLHAVLTKATNPAAHFIVQLLLKHGCDSNQQTQPRKETGGFMRDSFTKAETPLHRAAAFADAATIQLLLNAGADKTIKDMNGDSPLSWASWYNRSDIVIDLLCFGPHKISPRRIELTKKNASNGWSGMDYFLNGELHP